MASQSTSVADLQIRAATWNDASIIYLFVCALEECVLERTAFLDTFCHNLAAPAVSYLVAERAGEVVGFVSCHVQYLLHHGGKVAEIQELFVRPNVRNQHVGQQLIQAVHVLAIQKQCINLEVTTNQQRIDTVRFYERELFNRTHVKLVRPVQATDLPKIK